MPDPEFQNFLRYCQNRSNDALKLTISNIGSEFSDNPKTQEWLSLITSAINYSLNNPGKRIRPLLVYAGYQAVSNNVLHNSNQDVQTLRDLDQIACAAECIHAYSLIHDDLPAMDNDDLRRGLPTCHKRFDEATAILAGDALQAHAFELLSDLQCPAEQRITLIKILSAASGLRGMVGGQSIDLNAVDQTIDLDHLECMHHLKTGALIRGSISLGAHFAQASATQLDALDTYGKAIGLAFQVQDDILDITESSQSTGKPQGSDSAKNKPTYPNLLSLAGAQNKALALYQQATTAIEHFPSEAAPLRGLAELVINRRK